MTAVLLGFTTFVFFLIIYGLTLPKSVSFETSIRIQSEPENIFNQLVDFRQFVKWDPWSEKDPSIQLHFSENQKEIGSSFSWKGNRNVGKGSIQLIAFEPFNFVAYKLQFGPNSVATCAFHMELEENNTLVRWSFQNEVGKNPFYRILGKLFLSLIAKDYVKGLSNLKKITEHD